MAPQALARLDALARDATGDPPPPQILPTALGRVGFVGVPFGRALPRASQRPLDRLDRFHHGLEQRHVIHVRRREPDGERDAVGVDHKMALRARFAAIRRIPAGRFAPDLFTCR
jgi:hypothetical protein